MQKKKIIIIHDKNKHYIAVLWLKDFFVQISNDLKLLISKVVDLKFKKKKKGMCDVSYNLMAFWKGYTTTVIKPVVKISIASHDN